MSMSSPNPEAKAQREAGRVTYIERQSEAPIGPTDLGFEIVARSTLFSSKLGAVISLGGRIFESGGVHFLRCFSHSAWRGMERCPNISSPEYNAKLAFDMGNFKPLVCSTDSTTYSLFPLAPSPQLSQGDEEGMISFPNDRKYPVSGILADALPLLMALDHWKEFTPESGRLIFAVPALNGAGNG